jgi:hypothetical protein
MRTRIAMVALLCGTAKANADTAAFLTQYCSDGFDKPAVISDDGHFTIGGKVQNVTGQFFAEVVVYSKGDVVKRETVIVFRDRVFWLCDKSE